MPATDRRRAPAGAVADSPCGRRLKERGEAIARAQEKIGSGAGATRRRADRRRPGRAGPGRRRAVGPRLADARRDADAVGRADCGKRMIRIRYWRHSGRPTRCPAPGCGCRRRCCTCATRRRSPPGTTPSARVMPRSTTRSTRRVRPPSATGCSTRAWRGFAPGITFTHWRSADVLAALAPETERRDEPAATFGGFCADTFRFLAELAADNRREWMEAQRDRYRFAVREPLAELCQALAARYVGPVLHGVHGWDMDAEARSGRALTSICKNDYGRSRPYNTALWIAFCRPPLPSPSAGGRRRRPALRPAGRGRDCATAFASAARPREACRALPRQCRQVRRSALSGAARRRRAGRLSLRPGGRRRRRRTRSPDPRPAGVGRGAVVRDRRRAAGGRPAPGRATSWPAKSC